MVGGPDGVHKRGSDKDGTGAPPPTISNSQEPPGEDGLVSLKSSGRIPVCTSSGEVYISRDDFQVLERLAKNNDFEIGDFLRVISILLVDENDLILELDLSSSNVKDISAVWGLNALVHLDLSHTDVEELGEIGPNLRELILRESPIVALPREFNGTWLRYIDISTIEIGTTKEEVENFLGFLVGAYQPRSCTTSFGSLFPTIWVDSSQMKLLKSFGMTEILSQKGWYFDNVEEYHQKPREP